MQKTVALDINHDAWEIAEAHFPRNRTKLDKLRFVVSYATLAPSAHNSQPWLFRVEADAIELYADLNRALPAVDPNHRELMISCGAALYNLDLALRYFGYGSSVEIVAKEILPKAGDNKVLLARAHLGDPVKASSQESSLFHMITKRRTSRLKFEARPIPASILTEIEQIARTQGAWINLLQESPKRSSIADFVAQGNRVQIADKKFRDEIASWSASTRRGRRDGMPGYATGSSFLLTYAGEFLFRSFRFPDWQARRDRELVMQAPALLLLGTDQDSVEHWLRAGQALQAVALRAALADTWLAFLNQPIEVNALREYLRKEFNMQGYPQLLIRMGSGPASGHTPRRPVSEVLI